MFKKYLKTVLYLLIVISMTVSIMPAFAKAAGDRELISFASGMGIMNGYPDGSFGLGNNVTRGEFAKIAVASSKYKNSVGSSVTVSPFSDVPYYHWAAPHVRIATVNGFITGYVDATFKPDNYVLCEEAVTVALKMLGYTNEDFGASWPYGQLGLAANLNLTVGVNASAGQYMTRRDVAQLIYNLMNTQMKGSNSKYASELGCSYTEGVVLISSLEEDGVTKISTSSGTYTVYDGFDQSLIGQKGDIIVKNGDTLAAFVPYTQNVEKYVVYSKVDGVVVTYKDGVLSQISVNDSDTAYYNSSKTTYGSIKSNLSMGDIIYVKKNSSGQVEYINIAKSNLVGPYTVRASQWHTAFGDISNATIMRDGVKVSASDIKTYDVAYYSKDLNMIFAYSKKITGVYQSASPNSDNPESITVSGVTYKLESAEAFNAVSSTGTFRLGDTITLLIGRDGDVADVVDPDLTNDTVIGYLTGSGSKEFTNASGQNYASNYVTVVTVDGSENEYNTSSNYESKVGNVVKVTFKNGSASVATLNHRTGVWGDVSYSSNKIGDTKVSNNVKILDVALADSGNVGSWASVFMQRIDGVDLDEDDILYYEKNSAGEITSLILDDITGDAYQYGIVTSAQTSSREFSYSGRYVVDIGGKSYTHSLSAIYNGISTGHPVKVVMKNGAISTISSLPMLDGSITDITLNSITSGGKVYKISPDAVAYTKTYDYQYMITPLSDALEYSTAKMRVFFDKSPEYGGQVRMVVIDK